MKPELIDKGLYRILVPFEGEITTTVYILVNENDKRVVLIDSASYPTDAKNFIIPAIEELGISPDNAELLLLTHSHKDHFGGAKALFGELPNLKPRASFLIEHPAFEYLVDAEIIAERLKVVFLPGHTKNSVAFYDLETKTLLSGDCLQLKGVGKYRNGIAFPILYRNSIEKLKGMDIERIVAAHEYDPLGSIAEGKECVLEYLNECLSCLDKLD